MKTIPQDFLVLALGGANRLLAHRRHGASRRSRSMRVSLGGDHVWCVSAAARAALIKRTILCLKATGQAPAAGAPAGSGRFITFDPPGSTLTGPSAIAPDGTIIGHYCDTAACASQFGLVGAHGFLRSPTGSFTTFDPPGSTLTWPTSIAPTGEIAGAYCVVVAPFCVFGGASNHGFARASNGTFTTFDAPVPNIFASIYTSGGAPPSINPAGAIAGTYFDVSGAEHGFLRAGNDAVTTIDAPGAALTEVLAINPSGTLVGDFLTRPRANSCLFCALQTAASRRSTVRTSASTALRFRAVASIRRARSRGVRKIRAARSVWASCGPPMGKSPHSACRTRYLSTRRPSIRRD